LAARLTAAAPASSPASVARRGGYGTVAALLRFFSSFTICNSAETSVAAGGT